MVGVQGYFETGQISAKDRMRYNKIVFYFRLIYANVSKRCRKAKREKREERREKRETKRERRGYTISE